MTYELTESQRKCIDEMCDACVRIMNRIAELLSKAFDAIKNVACKVGLSINKVTARYSDNRNILRAEMKISKCTGIERYDIWKIVGRKRCARSCC
jgi:hypothetical protein